MKKRTAAALAALVLVLAAGAAPAKGELTPTGTFPILKQKLDMRFLTAQTIFIENWNTNRLSKYMEDKTNI
ncbi:MAG: ABC transporter substrate-binding protein, partial [Treponema sp.]|nr:ABC transporter substrate-binding protein [Treponema sp.]